MVCSVDGSTKSAATATCRVIYTMIGPARLGGSAIFGGLDSTPFVSLAKCT